MTKHVIQVSDGDIVELIPQDPDSSTKEDTAGFAAQLKSMPGAPADAARRTGVIISCPPLPLPQPPVMLTGNDVQGFVYNLGDPQEKGGSAATNPGYYGGYSAGVATGIALAILFL